jgi:DNA-binding transcriptional MerR regulator
MFAIGFCRRKGKNMERLLNVCEAARELGMSEDWLRVAEARGKIPKAKRDLNNWRVYSREDLALIKKLLRR